MLKKYTLLRSQRNRVYEMIREAGLEPSEFSWATETIAGSLVVSRLNFRDGTFYFQFSSHEVNAWCAASPGQFRSLDYEYPKTWEEQEGIFRKWVHWLQREVAAPDLWGELAKYTLAVGVRVDPDSVNEPISADEAQRIAETMGRLGDVVARELKLGPEENALVRRKVEYLAESARRQRSNDWVNTAVGVCASIALSVHLPRDRAAVLWQLFQREMGWFVHPVPPMPIKTVPGTPGKGAADAKSPLSPMMEP